MRFVFIVQGEGRGHMTQAVSLMQILECKGHDVSRIVVGKSRNREIPLFIKHAFGNKMLLLDSPNFVLDRKQKRIRFIKSIVHGVLGLRRYIGSVRKLRACLRSENPDLVVNFYDLLAGLAYFVRPLDIPYVCVGHQYLCLHSAFKFPRGHFIQRKLFRFYTRITAIGATKLLALSFRQLPSLLSSRLLVVPPLLRKEVFQLHPEKGSFILGYLLNKAYAEEVIAWHKEHPEEVAHFFWDNAHAAEETVVHRNLVFHTLSDTKFLDYMRRSKGVVTTAGFESVCEAMYLGKPLLLVPSYGHFEQLTNAIDAVSSGAGVYAQSFMIQQFVDYIPRHRNDYDTFKAWVESAGQQFIFHLVVSGAAEIETFRGKNCLSTVS